MERILHGKGHHQKNKSGQEIAVTRYFDGVELEVSAAAHHLNEYSPPFQELQRHESESGYQRSAAMDDGYEPRSICEPYSA